MDSAASHLASRELLWGVIQDGSLLERRVGQEVISKRKMKVHWRKISGQVTLLIGWAAAFQLAGLIAAQEENFPSSYWGSKVAAFPVWEWKVTLFLLGSVIDIFHYGVIDFQWWGVRAASAGYPNSNFNRGFVS